MLRALHWEKSTGVAARLTALAQRAWRPATLMALMFLCMRAELLLRASPLAAALMAAGVASGESAAALVAGCLLGMLRLPVQEISLLPAVSCAILLCAELLLGLLPLRLLPQTRVSLLAGFSALLPPLVQARSDLLFSAQALACGALAAASAPFFAAALAVRPGRSRLMLQEKAGIGLMAGACLAGLYALLPPLAEGAAVLMVLVLPGLGAGGGVLAGLALIAGGAGMAELARLALCALAASGQFWVQKWQRALSLCVAALLGALLTRFQAAHLFAALSAAAVFLLLPKRMTDGINAQLSPPEPVSCDPAELARELSADARQRLMALGDAFGEMADGCAAPSDVPDEQALICEMRARLCSGCAAYEDCWAGSDNRAVRLLCQLISDALARVDAPPGMRVLFSDGEIPPDILRVCRRGRMIPDRLGLLLRDFGEKRRSEIKRCTTGQLMSVQFMQAREILYNLAERQQAPVRFEGVRLDQLRASLEAEGLGSCAVFFSGAQRRQIHVSRPAAPWTREEVRRAGAALSRVCGGRFSPEICGESLRFTQRPRYRADTGANCQSGVAGQVCGDSHMVRMLGPSKLVIMLSDGMGLGEAAAGESMETLRLLWRFLEAGISRSLALETVNQQMLMRSGEEMFATVDLCILDLNTGVAEMTKLAACRTLILRGGEILPVEGGHLPLGILERVQPAVSRVRLRPGDLLVMGSDGVMEAGDTLMIEHLARQGAALNPEQLAEHLVREAGLRRGDSRADDLTCICVRLEDARQSAEAQAG